MKKVKFTELQIKEYKITGGYFQAIEETEKVKVDLPSLPVSVEYSIHTDNKDGIIIVVEVGCNKASKPKPGYSFEFSAQAGFEVPENLENRDKLILYSCLPMVINNLRGYISSVTALSWHGPYLLPAIDVKDVIQKHNAQAKKK